MARGLFWRKARSRGKSTLRPHDVPAAPKAIIDRSNKPAVSRDDQREATPSSDQPRPLTRDDRLKARSLIAAWRAGAAWSPEWHRSWLKETQPSSNGAQVDDELEDDDKSGNDDPSPEGLTIRASIVRDMLDDPQHSPKTFDAEPLKLTNKGASLENCTIIDGPLDLSALRFDRPIWMTKCKFPEPFMMTDAKLGRLCLEDSEFHSIIGENVHIDGEMSLSDVEVKNHIALDGAKIDGIFRLSGAKLNTSGEGAFALKCQVAEFGVTVLMNDEFLANGEVNFNGVIIKGELDCSGGSFHNEGGKALDCDGATFGADASMADDFEAKGEVNFRGATIRGLLDCSHGSFQNGSGTALSCNGATIESWVFLRNKFEAVGEVDLVGATIRGGLDCSQGSFDNKKNGADENKNKENTDVSERIALNCGSVTVGADVFLSNQFEAIGEVSFVGATIKAHLVCNRGRFQNEDGIGLNLQAATIASHVYFADRFHVLGTLDLISTKIDGKLTINGATIGSKKGHWADLNSASINGVLDLGAIDWGETALDLRGANAGSLSDLGAHFWPRGRFLRRLAWFCWWRPRLPSWPRKGRLYMDGFTYERFVDPLTGSSSVDTSFELRRAWLDLRFTDWLSRPSQFRPQPHTQCAKVLQASGHSRDARLIRHDRERLWAESTETAFLLKPFFWVFNILAGYGFKTYRAFAWALAIWLAAVPFYHVAYQNGRMFPDNPLVMERYEASCDTGKGMPDTIADELSSNKAAFPGYEGFDPIVYSLDVFVPLMEFGQTAKWRPWGQLLDGVQCTHEQAGLGLPLIPVAVTDLVRPHIERIVNDGWLPWIYWLQVIFGWLLTTIVITGLSGLLQRGDRD